MKKKLLAALAVVAMAGVASADIAVTIDSTAMANGFLNVSELPANGGGFVFGSGWAPADLSATFDSPTQVTLMPNSIGDPNEFWYQNTSGTAPDPINPGGPGQLGNKSMEANLYGEDTGLYNGQTVTFAGNVTALSLTSAHTAIAYIKDFAPDFSSFVESTVALDSTGLFSIDLATINDPLRHVQWGLQMTGENVWATDLAPFGSVTVDAIPEPATFGLLGIFGGGMLFLRRRFRI